MAALIIAASSSDSGAGANMDLKTFAVHKVYAACIITAITSQNTKGVGSVYNLPSREISKQLDSVLADFKIDFVKMGLIGDSRNFATIAKKLKNKKLVLDPVLSAQSDSSSFASKEYVREMKKFLKHVYLLTPNAAEAQALTGTRVGDERTAILAAYQLHLLGAKNVLVKGVRSGKGARCISDFLLTEHNHLYEFQKPLIKKGTHGGGCLFSSAITANLAKGMDLLRAVGEAEEFTEDAIRKGKKIGKGIEIVEPFF